MPSGRTRWPDAGDRSAAGVSESLTGRVAGDGRQQISVAAPDRDSTAAEGRPSTDPTHLTAGVGEVNRAVGRSSAQAVGGVRNFVGVNDFEHGLGGPEGVGRSGFPINPLAPATTTAAGARTSANPDTSVPPAINPSAQVLGGTATTVGAASNSGVSSNAAGTSSQAIGSPSIAGTTPG
ncbi:MAG TPA: hypothetical protein VKP69_06515, partial [Isosphaeraceae bacterium]|nr:hypothetical protein [Isosphaeraceae bacterium]